MLSGVGQVRREMRAVTADSLNVVAFPYRNDLVEVLRSAAQQGRRVVLWAPAADSLARAVAAHFGFIHEVLPGASDRQLSAAEQRSFLETRFKATGFDYIAGSVADLPLLIAARQGYLVGVSRTAASRAQASAPNVDVLSTNPSKLKAALRVMRPQQWAKNALVFVPALLAPGLPSSAQLQSAALAALALSLCASAGYVFNDLIDVEADRAHRTKHRRPFASGDLPVRYGPPLFIALGAASFGLAIALLPLAFVAMLAAYFIATVAYSSVLKSKLMVDVVLLAWLYTHRVLAGGIAAGVAVSAWLLAFSMFMFSSLAFAKRYVELRQSLTKKGQIKSRGYYTDDLEMVASMGPTAGFIAVLVFCLYIDSNAVTARYRTPVLLWFGAPVLLYWISRVWFLAHRGHMQDDPVKFALGDWRSWLCAVALASIMVLARFWSV